MEQLCLMPGIVCFLDDMLVTGKNDYEHLAQLEEVFRRLHKCGLKVKRKKCCFFQDCIEYLGHKIDKDGLHVLNDRFFAIKKLPVPKNVAQLKAFLGSVNFYYKFIQNASLVLKPLSTSTKTR